MSPEAVFVVVGVAMVVIFGGLITLMISLGMRAVKRERMRRAQLWAYAAQVGWQPLQPGIPVPGPVADAARSRRSQMVVRTRLREFDMWLVWHQWTESTSSGDSTTTQTRHLTRYYLWPNRPYPNVQLVGRTRIGASLMPVRGAGTGDAEFDRRFLVRGTPELLSPALRQAMLAGSVPVWQLNGGTLITAYNDSPRPDTLQYRAEVISQIARCLPT